MNHRQPEGKGKAGSAPEALPEAIVKKKQKKAKTILIKGKDAALGRTVFLLSEEKCNRDF